MLAKWSRFVTSNLEKAFFAWGLTVARHPFPVILGSLILSAIFSLGLLRLRMEHQADLLWIPSTSDYNVHKAWLKGNFEKLTREELVIVEGENVLQPAAIQKMLTLHNAVSKSRPPEIPLDEVCARLPVADIFQTRKRRQAEDGSEEDYDDFWADYADYSEEEEQTNLTVKVAPQSGINLAKFGRKRQNSEEDDQFLEDLPDDIYCSLVTTLKEKCVTSSLLEMWRFNEAAIKAATLEEVVEGVNRLERSPWFGFSRDFSSMLGGVTKNSTGHIIAATSALMVWVLEVDPTSLGVASAGSGVELGLADPASLAWEDTLVATALNLSTPEIRVLVNAQKSFGDLSATAIFFDAGLMGAGYLLMGVYTVLVLGTVSWTGLRLYLTLAGLFSVLLGLVVGLGLSSALGFPVTPLHTILPFLCLGIGIDDMFVITQCWNNLGSKPGLSRERRLGLTLAHAGLSITVTSVTDIAAFGVGAVTLMPGLQSFCVCTAAALAAIFLLSVTWFVAWMWVDECRVATGRNSILPCIRHQSDAKSAEDSAPSLFFSTYLSSLSSMPMAAIVVLTSLGLGAVGIWGSMNILQQFDPTLLLASDSYLRAWLDTRDSQFPSNGWEAEVYTGAWDSSHLEGWSRLHAGLKHLEEEGEHIKAFDCWWTELEAKLASENRTWEEMSDEGFGHNISSLLFSPLGARFKPDFKFDKPLECGSPAPQILATRCRVTYQIFSGPHEHSPARHTVEAIIKDSGLPAAFSHSLVYAAWETDEIIGGELWRNLGLALLAVLVVTLLLLGSVRLCILVLATVLLTLVDLIGFLHFWGITIDIISCINVILAVGFCVDYSCHIAHSYLASSGSSAERAGNAVATIGPAVLNGGVTTLIALVLLGFSTSHVFVTFFRVFVLTVVFGLFHGLVLLPVLLAHLGPRDEEDGDVSLGNKMPPSPSSSSSSSSASTSSSSIPTFLSSSSDSSPSLSAQKH